MPGLEPGPLIRSGGPFPDGRWRSLQSPFPPISLFDTFSFLKQTFLFHLSFCFCFHFCGGKKKTGIGKQWVEAFSLTLLPATWAVLCLPSPSLPIVVQHFGSPALLCAFQLLPGWRSSPLLLLSLT